MYFLLLITIFLGLIFFLTWPNRLKSGVQSFYNKTFKIEPTNEISVLSWNMAYLYGPGSEGINYAKKDQVFFKHKLSEAIDLLKRSNADIILLQETDFKAKKTHYINQAKEIADALGYNYAPAKSWHCRYVPYPMKDFKNHFGYVESGGAVLSKFPIKDNYIHLHKKPKKNYFFNLFYIFRYSQIVSLEINNKVYQVVNNHLEAFSKENRSEQAEFLLKELRDKNILLIGGDLNTLPSSAIKKSNFTPYDIEDFIDDKTYDLFAGVYKDVLDTSLYQADEKKYFTFSSAHEDRKLDHIFTPHNVEALNFKVIKSKVSDHYPIKCTLKLPTLS